MACNFSKSDYDYQQLLASLSSIKMFAKMYKKKLNRCAAWTSVKSPIKPEHYIVSSSYQDTFMGIHSDLSCLFCNFRNASVVSVDSLSLYYRSSLVINLSLLGQVDPR